MSETADSAADAPVEVPPSELAAPEPATAAAEPQIPQSDEIAPQNDAAASPENATESKVAAKAGPEPAATAGKGFPDSPVTKESIARRRARIEQSRREQQRAAHAAMLAHDGGAGGLGDAAVRASTELGAGGSNLEATEGENAELDVKDLRPSQRQIAQSWKRIDLVLSSGSDAIEELKARVVKREVSRRVDAEAVEEQFQQEWQRSAADTQAGEAALEQQWAKALAIENNPYAVFEMLQAQKAACVALVKRRDEVLAAYEKDLKARDEEYIRENKRQSEEIDTLLDRVERQFRELQGALRQEIVEIERAHVQERAQLNEQNDREIAQMNEQRRTYEGRALDESHQRFDQYRNQMDELYTQDAEEYNLVRLKLESDVQVLEQQLQQMRATYQLNVEKLEYNFQVLKKREEENGTILTNQKRKINRLTDVANALKGKLERQQRSSQNEFTSLTEEYKRIAQQFHDMKGKFHYFQGTDHRNYCDIWRMNDQTAKDLARRLVQVDRFITEQLLGLSHVAPSRARWLSVQVDPLLQSPQDLERIRETAAATKAAAAAVVVDSGASVVAPEPSGLASDISSNSAPGAAAETASSVDSLASKMQTSRLYNNTVRQFFDFLCDEAAFLVEDKLQTLLAPLRKDEQNLMKLDSIFKALKVTSTEHVQQLLQYFVIPPGQRERYSPDDALVAPEADATAVRLIHPNNVLRAIQAFLESARGGDTTEETAAGSTSDKQLATAAAAPQSGEAESDEDDAAVLGAPGDVNATVADILSANARSAAAAAAEARKQQRAAAQERIRAREVYWRELGSVIDDAKARQWGALLKTLETHHANLAARATLAQEVLAIKQQNQELKHLLRQYMASSVNEELAIPPTQVLLARAGMSGTSATVAAPVSSAPAPKAANAQRASPSPPRSVARSPAPSWSLSLQGSAKSVPTGKPLQAPTAAQLTPEARSIAVTGGSLGRQ